MRNHSYNIKLVGGVEKRDPNVSIPGTWSKQTNQNIKESQGNFFRFWYENTTVWIISLEDIKKTLYLSIIFLGARSKSTWLRGHVQNTITQNANNMHNSWNCTNSALQQRISETRIAKENLENHLNKTHQEIMDQDKEIASLTKALRDKEAPLKVFNKFIQILPLLFTIR